ncbi:MAG: hypothetical protein R3Y09_06675 [Clostridia bacterium]
MALKDFQNEIIVMNKEFVQDELGGMKKKWTEGITVSVVIERASAFEQSIATQKELGELWVLICSDSINFDRNDYIKYKGRYMRITSEEIDTPSKASSRVKSHQYQAEVVEVLPNV